MKISVRAKISMQWHHEVMMFRMRRLLSILVVMTCLGQVYASSQSVSATPDLQVGALAPGELPVVYSPNPQDSWNRIFRALFTRNVRVRLTEDFPQGKPFMTVFGPGDSPTKVSSQTYVRHESGDRAIAPLYWTFLTTSGITQVLTEPLYSQLTTALRDALAETNPRPAVQRALMQADVWAAYDLLEENSSFGVRVSSDLQSERGQLLSLLARFVRKLALTAAQVHTLPNNYASSHLDLPALFEVGSGWIEVQWSPERMHDFDARMRTAARVFVRPREAPPADIDAFLNPLRDPEVASKLEAVALVTELLLITNDGVVVHSPLTSDVQVRRFIHDAHGDFVRTEVEEFELSRESLVRDSISGGLLHESADFPAYLAMAGNDYRFASPQLIRNRGIDLPWLASLSSRCASCHGSGIGAIFTLSRISPESMPPVKSLPSEDDLHARYVAQEKMRRPEFHALLAAW